MCKVWRSQQIDAYTLAGISQAANIQLGAGG
jgi:hypothetical protein